MQTSRSRDRLVRLLNKMGYVFRECLLAPFNFGVPNDRLRYFLMARLRSTFENDQQQQSGILHAAGFDPETELIYTNWPFPAFVEDPKKKLDQHPFVLPEIRHFLDKDEDQTKEFLLPRQLILERPNFRFGKEELHWLDRLNSCCFLTSGINQDWCPHRRRSSTILQQIKLLHQSVRKSPRCQRWRTTSDTKHGSAGI